MPLNGFRFCGDMCHIVAVVFLLGRLFKNKSCAGISAKTQVLFGVVFAARYVDLFVFGIYVSTYNSLLKVTFLGASLLTVFLMYFCFRATADAYPDPFRAEMLLGAAAIMAYLVHYEYSFFEVCWSFSIYLEAVAILPQSYLTYKARKTDVGVCFYVLCLLLYRALYILNWVYRYFYEGFWDYVSFYGGCVQTACMISCLIGHLRLIWKHYDMKDQKLWVMLVTCSDVGDRYESETEDEKFLLITSATSSSKGLQQNGTAHAIKVGPATHESPRTVIGMPTPKNSPVRVPCFLPAGPRNQGLQLLNTDVSFTDDTAANDEGPLELTTI